jgi:hypothetical protein
MAEETKTEKQKAVDSLTSTEIEKKKIDEARAKAKEERNEWMAKSREKHRGLRSKS